MLAEIMREPAYDAYRSRLHALLQFPTDASEMEIHILIRNRFAAKSLMRLIDRVMDLV